jgi:hypothetical protein
MAFMRFSNPVSTGATFCLFVVVCSAQLPNAAAPAPTEPLPVSLPSGILQPSLNKVQQTLAAIKMEKWKRGTVRDEAGTNIAAVLRDIQTNLPPLITVADSTPETLSNVLPVSRNIDALYDVLLRVVEASRVSAPAEQISQLEDALESLSRARLSLDDRMQDSAAALEKQVTTLQTSLKAQAAVKCPATPAPAASVCTPPAPAHKAVRKSKLPAAHPQTTSPGTTTTTPSKNPQSTPQKATPQTAPSKAPQTTPQKTPPTTPSKTSPPTAATPASTQKPQN